MRGQFKRLSPPRRAVTDLMRFAIKVPAIPAQRVMNLSPVIAARNAAGNRLSWSSIFAKAFAIAARDFPPLRQVFLSYPWPHLYEYDTSVANIAVARSHQGEPNVLGCVIKDPAALALDDIAARIDYYAQEPIENIHGFQRQMKFSSLPGLIRRPLFWLVMNVARLRGRYFGSFALSTITSFGSELILTVSPLTTVLAYGFFQSDGTIAVRITFDHRVMDGVTVARALDRMEDVLNGEIAAELKVLQSGAGAEAARRS
jgi:hypothetical protein